MRVNNEMNAMIMSSETTRIGFGRIQLLNTKEHQENISHLSGPATEAQASYLTNTATVVLLEFALWFIGIILADRKIKFPTFMCKHIFLAFLVRVKEA
jgi:hypothetical protein